MAAWYHWKILTGCVADWNATGDFSACWTHLCVISTCLSRYETFESLPENLGEFSLSANSEACPTTGGVEQGNWSPGERPRVWLGLPRAR